MDDHAFVSVIETSESLKFLRVKLAQIEAERRRVASLKEELKKAKEQHFLIVRVLSHYRADILHCTLITMPLVRHVEDSVTPQMHTVTCYMCTEAILSFCKHVFSVPQQKQVEQEEEYLVNKLSKRLDQLKREKQTLANEVEQEEECASHSCLIPVAIVALEAVHPSHK